MQALLATILERAADATSRGALDQIISEYIDALPDIPGWTLDETAETDAAKALARVAPDALIQVPYSVNGRFLERRRWPRKHHHLISQLKRAVADALADVFPATDAARPAADAPIRAAILVPWLPNNPNNNILRVVAGYLGGLLQQGEVEDCALVLTNEMSYPAGAAPDGERGDARQSRATHEAVVEEFGAGKDKLFYAPPPFCDEGNFNWNVDFRNSFRPNVIFVPNFEMSSAFVHAFGASAATVYLQTSIRNRPNYDFDRYLYLGERREIDASHIHREKWHYHTFGYGNFGADEGLSRADIGFGGQDFIMVSAGNRLEKEIDPEIAGIAAEAMERVPHAKWLLLGVQDEAQIRANLGDRFDGLMDRVIVKPYVRAIGDHMALSDIYVNPRRTGGAVSMALAVHGRTPVIGFNHGDACNFLIDEMIHTTAESYAARLIELATDDKRMEEITDAQCRHFEKHHTLEASAADLVTHFRAAMAGE